MRNLVPRLVGVFLVLVAIASFVKWGPSFPTIDPSDRDALSASDSPTPEINTELLPLHGLRAEPARIHVPMSDTLVAGLPKVVQQPDSQADVKQ